MSSHSLRGLAVVVLLAVAAPAVAGQSITLGSGKSVEILAVAPVQSGDGRPKLAITYRSQLAPGQDAALRKEVDEIWQQFVADVDHENFDTAVITASQARGGGSHDFVFTRKDGKWRTYEARARRAAKLDRAFVAEFIDRLDWLYEHRELDALQLYLAGDWTLTSTSPAENRLDPHTVTLGEFIETMEAFSSAIRRYRHRREIADIAIGSGGTTARVSSREFEDIVTDEDRIITSSHSFDVVELTGDGIMLLKHSENVMDKITKLRAAELAPPALRRLQPAAAAR